MVCFPLQLTTRVVRVKQQKRSNEESYFESWCMCNGFFFLLLLTSGQLFPKAEDKPKVTENPFIQGQESQAEPRSVPFIPGQEYQKFDYKVKVIRRRKRSGVRGRRKRRPKIRGDLYDEWTAESPQTVDDVGLFTRLWRWLCSFFTWKTTSTTSQRDEFKEVCKEDVEKTARQEDAGVRIQKELDDKVVVVVRDEKGDYKETTTSDIRDEELKLENDITEEENNDCIVEQKVAIQKDDKSNMEDGCTTKTVASKCCPVRRLETHVLQKTDKPKTYNVVPLKQLESKVQMPVRTETVASQCCPIRRLETHVLQKTDKPNTYVVPLKQLEGKPSTQLQVTEASLEVGEAKSHDVSTSSCYRKEIWDTHVLQKTDDPKTFNLVPLQKKRLQDGKVAKITSWSKDVIPNTSTRDAQLQSSGLSTPRLLPSKGRSTFKDDSQPDRKSRENNQKKDHMTSTSRSYHKPKKNSRYSNSKRTGGPSCREELGLSWRNQSKESAESSKGHMYLSWRQKECQSSESSSSSLSWRSSSSKGDMSSNWRQHDYTARSSSRTTQPLSWRKHKENTRDSPNEEMLYNWRNDRQTKVPSSASNWRITSESRPRKQRNNTKEKSAEKLYQVKPEKESEQKVVKECMPRKTYAEAVVRGGSGPFTSVRNSPVNTALNTRRVEPRAWASKGRRRNIPRRSERHSG
ncbi:uncharacterized protein LOC116304061 [Actinia tenebrosa]|uniref:Uncharacterized protein LOC116304061 n=1 Tax=Actinia tenebrosa TaxID=6105 RepID=A0A6P8IRR3_ACTTE|nr:uncharacterized protein LOC116304061 [Actinia tenebrosa]